VKWYCVFSSVETAPIEWEKLDAADVVYTFAGALRHLPPERCRGKLLVLYLDKLIAGRSQLHAIGRLNQFPCDVVLDIPPSKMYAEEIKAARRLAGVVERGAVLPWATAVPPFAQEPRLLHFARSDPRYEGYVKGTDYVLELLEEFPHDIIGDVAIGHWLGWVPLEEQLRLQRRCRLLLHPSRLDSSSRTLCAAIALEQVSVLAYREAEYLWSLSFGRRPEDYLPQYFPIAHSKIEYQEIVRRLMTDDEAYRQAFDKLLAYKAAHPTTWDPAAIYGAFAGQGLHLPRDLTPMHHLPLHRRELLDSLPPGPWSGNDLSLNYT
jgi:hypothetical protein